MTGRVRELRVLHVLHELRPSGAEMMLRDALPRWRDAGIVGDVLATADRRGAFADQLAAAGARVHHLPFAPRPSHLVAFGRLLRDGGYDIAHVHTERAGFWYGLTASTLPAVAVARTVHNVFAFEGALRVERTAQRRLLRLLGARTISVGPAVRDNERDRFHHPTVHLPNWLDTTRFPPPSPQQREVARRALQVEGDHLVVASLGNCNPAKNHPAILHALAEIGTDLDWCYLHAGEEPDADERELAHDLGIDDRCRFLGPVSEVVTLLHASDVFAMPSHVEGMSIAALEAIATGVPCVLADVPGVRGIREVVDEGIVWIPPSAEGVRDGLRTAAVLASDDVSSRRDRMHDAVRRHHGIEAGVRGYADVYRELASGRTASTQ